MLLRRFSVFTVELLHLRRLGIEKDLKECTDSYLLVTNIAELLARTNMRLKKCHFINQNL